MTINNKSNIKDKLFNNSIDAESYANSTYQEHILEQYKIYVEMADRISHRRSVANTFFSSINTSYFFAYINFNNSNLVLSIVGVLNCFVWFLILRNYRNLNSAKFKVIGLLEEKLPASPYWNAEWTALGEGKDWKKYIPLSLIETFVPFLFSLVYIVVVIVNNISNLH